MIAPANPLFSSASSKLASLAEFERDLVRERVSSGVAAAKARGQKFGRQTGQRVKADKLGPKVLQIVSDGYSYRKIAEKLNLSKTTPAIFCDLKKILARFGRRNWTDRKLKYL